MDDFNEDLQESLLLCNAPNDLAAIINLYYSELSPDLQESLLLCNAPNDLAAIINLYYSELSHLLDKHAPLKTKSIVERTVCKWFTSELGECKQQLRPLEC